MNIHPSTLLLSRSLALFLPIPGIVALITFLSTLCHSVYPGHSATLIAAAAGLTPPSGADHPVFAMFLRPLVEVPVLSLPVRLNLFSTFCGTLCVILLYHLVARLILFFASETRTVYAYGGTGGTDVQPDLPEDATLFNRSMFRLAVGGGLVSAFLLIFMVPFWSASTRAHPAPFDLLLALASFELLLTYFVSMWWPLRISSLVLSVFLFTLGLFETAAFLPLLACYAFFIFVKFCLSSQKKAIFYSLLLAGTAGVACAAVAFFQNSPTIPSTDILSQVLFFISSFSKHHLYEIQSFFPRIGWGVILMQTALPAAILLFGVSTLLKGGFGRIQALILVTLFSLPSLLNLHFSAWFFFQIVDHLPVFPYTVIAATIGIVIAACLKMILTPADIPVEGDESNDPINREQSRRAQIERFFSWCVLVTLLLAGALTPWRSYHDTDTRSSGLADVIARDMITVMGPRTWLISNGGLDNHLLIQAHLLKHPLKLVTLRQRPLPSDFNRLNTLIATDPVFEGQNRIRLQNALSIGTVRFIMEWFKSDPQAISRTMVFATPEMLTACGYRAIPEGLAFGGIPHDAVPDVAKITEQNRCFADRIAPLLAPQKRETRHVAFLRQFIRMKASYTANELGVFLEEMNQAEAAYQSYLRASQLDPMNISADINAYALASVQNLHPEEVERLRRKIKANTSNMALKNLSLTGILQTYGTIRQPDFYRQQSRMWSTMGVPIVATDKIAKASTLSARSSIQSLVDSASFYLQTGAFSKAEECCQAALDKDPSNVAALSAMATLSLNGRKLEAAEAWLNKASRAGADAPMLLHQTIMLALFRNQDALAHTLLLKATKENPSDVRYWTLLAEVLLKQNSTQEVEFQVLPAVQKALNTPDHFLVHTVRGFLLRKKGARFYKEARIELLKALSLNANLPDVWGTVFELDLALGNVEFMEVDAKNQLALDPDHALANYLLGTINLTRGALAKSEDFLRRSVEKHPTAPACNDLAENLRQQKRLADAEPFARQALAIQPEFPSALDTLACILLDGQRIEEAAHFAEMANTKCPNTPAYKLTLLRIRVKQNNLDEVNRLSSELTALKTPVPEELQKEIRALRQPVASTNPIKN